MFSMRAKASRGVLAWMVVRRPSWPVFIACIMSRASAPRTSPITMRSGRMRRAVAHQFALGDLPVPFDIRRAGLQAHHMGLLQLQLGRVLDGDDPLVVRNEAGQDIEHGGLAGAGTAGDEHVEPPANDGLELAP